MPILALFSMIFDGLSVVLLHNWFIFCKALPYLSLDLMIGGVQFCLDFSSLFLEKGAYVCSCSLSLDDISTACSSTHGRQTSGVV